MASKKRFKHKLPSIRLRKFHNRKKPGSAPGTIEHIGERHLDEINITVYDYDEENLQELSIDKIQKAKPYLDAPSKTWLKVSGLHDTEKLKSIWNFFDLHPLIQEDIVNTSQRPKVEVYNNCIFFVLRLLSYSKDKGIQTEQISIVLGDNYVMSFQETAEEHFSPVMKRLAVWGSRIRKKDADYLTYALIDTVVDYYFNVLEYISDDISDTEDELLEKAEDHILQKLHKLRREVIYFRKSVWPLRDAINSIIRDDQKFIASDTKIFLRDVYDHVIQIIDNNENYRDMITGMHDMYMSQVSNRMNEVMKVLTIIATIFIPLTFIAGIYGMNFNPDTSPFNMPELNWYWGYPASLVIMLTVALGMIIYFKRKGWF